MPRRPDGYDDCALTDGPGGAGAKAYTFGPTGPAGVHEAGGSTFVQLGQRGDVVGLTDPSGAVVATRGYDDWGRIQAATGLGSTTATAASGTTRRPASCTCARAGTTRPQAASARWTPRTARRRTPAR